MTTRHKCTKPACQDENIQLRISSKETAFPIHLASEMPLNSRPSRDAPPHQPRSIVHTLAIAFFILLAITVFTTLLTLSFLDPSLVLTIPSSLKPIIIFILESAAELIALYLVHSLAQAIRLCYHMKKREYERNTHQAQVFGHANMYFVDEW